MKHKGDEGEVIAIKYLQRHNYQICETNFRFWRFGEIDIIAQKHHRYHFIEVKYRSHLGYGSPEESIIPAKLKKCRKTMEYYCKKNAVSLQNIQFDVLAILKIPTGHRVTRYPNVEVW